MKLKRTIALVLLICVALLSFTSCEKYGEGASYYLENRDITDRDVHYVEICFEGIGKCVVLLDATTAPITVENFLKLVNEGFYDGLTMHRIIEGFMIQGGDPEANGSGGSKNTIKGEFKSNGHSNDIAHLKGTISMARSGDPNSASSQFFICNADSIGLDGDYAAFGYVVKGLSVIDDVTEAALQAAFEYYGNNYTSWLYYGNGAMPAGTQPTIEYIKELKDYRG